MGPSPSASVHLLGIRHHGPGSARSVRRALDELEPSAVLIELPADCEGLLEWVGHDRLVPPVAMLGHGAAGSAFLPFAVFSPEWQAALWARARDVPLHAIDLPLAASLAIERHARGDDPHDAADPLGALAAAAGDDDAERWWDDVVEHRGDGLPAFDAVAEAMRAARLDLVPGDGDPAASLTLVREAHMRTVLRRVLAEGHASIAVVCGAWHVPALEQPWPSAADDRRVVKAASTASTSGSGRRVAVSWVPWTHRRLLAAGGYGAGVRSPGWYAHVFQHPGTDGVTRWFVDAARLVRSRGMSASPDHLIAASRAADALAAIRGRPRAGLDEVRDAAEAVMPGALALIERELEVGDAIGSVPDDAPQVPLAVDLAAQQRSVRLKPVPDAQRVELDLRTPNGRARSVLLHRLRALEVPWGALIVSRSSTGTFRETWEVRWEPELSISVVERSAYGLTVEAAASALLRERGVAAGGSLPDMVRLLERALLADLPAVVHELAAGVEHRAARDPDILELFDALEPLAHTLRYGDVRGTDHLSLRAVYDGMVVRVLAGAVVASRSLDDDAAATMSGRLSAVQAALALVDHPARRGEWPAVLAILAERTDVHGLVQGRAVRLLHDGGAWLPRRVGHRLSRALSPGTTPATGASFVEGLLAGSAALLVHERVLLDEVDAWISSLAADAFDQVVPLLRRTFGAFEAAERRQIGRLLASGRVDGDTPSLGTDLDDERARLALDTVRTLFGVPR